MKFIKNKTASKNADKRPSARNAGRALALGLFLLLESCAAGPAAVMPQKCQCNSPAECELAAIEKRVEQIEEKLGAVKQKIYSAEKKVADMRKAQYNMSVEVLLQDAKKRACEKFKDELRLMKELARYDEHKCVERDGFDAVLKAKVRVHCPHIHYLADLIKKNCSEDIKD